jgi:hypothetical protein
MPRSLPVAASTGANGRSDCVWRRGDSAAPADRSPRLMALAAPVLEQTYRYPFASALVASRGDPRLTAMGRAEPVE